MSLDNTSYLCIESYSGHPEVAKAAQMLVEAYFSGGQRRRDEALMFRDAKKLIASLWIRKGDMFRFTTKAEAFSPAARRQVWMTNRTLKLFKTAGGLGWYRQVARAITPRPEIGKEGRSAVYCRSLEFRHLLKHLTVNDIEPDADLPRVELRGKDKCLKPLPREYLGSRAYKRTVDVLESHYQLLRDSNLTLDGGSVLASEYWYTRKFSGDLEHGGRFYAPFTNWKKQDRLRLQINGEPVGSLDISQLHPALLLRLMHKTDKELPVFLPESLLPWLPQQLHW